MKSRTDCVSNRNTIIMGNFAKNRMGSTAHIFDGLNYPRNVTGKTFGSPEDFYMWEHGWHSLETYATAYRRLRDLFGPNTYAECGATVAKYHSLGLIGDVAHVVGGIENSLAALPEVNSNFNDTKDLIIAVPPQYQKATKQITCTLIIRFHDDIDPHTDYISDPHIRGILREIPCIWGKKPAIVTQPLVPYDFEKLCIQEPEFRNLDLDPKVEGATLWIRDPVTLKKRLLAKRVILEPGDTEVENKNLRCEPVFLGKYREWDRNRNSAHQGFMVTESLSINGTTLFPEGTILGAPYFVINFQSEKEGGLLSSFFHATRFKLKSQRKPGGNEGLLEALNQISNESKEKSEAYDRLTEEFAKTQDLTGFMAHHANNKFGAAKDRLKILLAGKAKAEEAIFNRLLDLIEDEQFPHDFRDEIGAAIFELYARIEKAAKNIEKSIQSMERGLSIIDETMRYGHIQRDSVIGVHELRTLVDAAITETNRSFPDTQISNPIDAGLYVRIDDKGFIKSIKEIFKNSIEARGENFKLWIEFSKTDENSLQLRINDTGTGIPDDYIRRVFYPLYTSKPEGDHPGLGLSIAQRYIELYGGSLTLTSENSRGTTVTIQLPTYLEG